MSAKYVAPVALGLVPQAELKRFRAVVNKVVCAAAADGLGDDLLLRVYMAGLYHGTIAAQGWGSAPSPTGGER